MLGNPAGWRSHRSRMLGPAEEGTSSGKIRSTSRVTAKYQVPNLLPACSVHPPPPSVEERGPRASVVNGTAPSVSGLSCYSHCNNILMSAHPNILPSAITHRIKERHIRVYVYTSSAPYGRPSQPSQSKCPLTSTFSESTKQLSWVSRNSFPSLTWEAGLPKGSYKGHRLFHRPAQTMTLFFKFLWIFFLFLHIFILKRFNIFNIILKVTFNLQFLTMTRF